MQKEQKTLLIIESTEVNKDTYKMHVAINSEMTTREKETFIVTIYKMLEKLSEKGNILHDVMKDIDDYEVQERKN